MKDKNGAGEMHQWIKILVALAKVPSAHMAADNHSELQLQGTQSPLLASNTRHIHGPITHTYTHTLHLKKNKSSQA